MREDALQVARVPRGDPLIGEPLRESGFQDRGLVPHSHRRAIDWYVVYSGPKSESIARSSGWIWNRFI
jgi:hypothetical protein